MKKLFLTALVLTALLAATVGTAFAGSALELYQVQNNGGGVTFTFRVNGEFSADELASGFVQVEGGDAYPLYCSQTAPDEVVCHTSKKVAGKNVVVGFGGARFWDYVPEFVPRGTDGHTGAGPGDQCAGYSYSYSAWDASWTGTWLDYGPICQNEPASLFDIAYYEFDGGSWWVSFYDYDVSGNCPEPVPYEGPAYYYPFCP